jgi:hypothetical protein
MTPEELKFIEDNRINFESVKLGFTRNIPFPILETYESLYRKYLDSQFVLTYWCGECVFEMLNRLIHFCENNQAYINATIPQLQEHTELESEEQVEQQIEEAPKKRGRKKKTS